MNRTLSRTDGSEALDHLIRGGLVVYGVVHLLIGWLALQVAFGEKSETASGTGAMRELASQPLGGFMVWTVAIGMFVLVLWRGLEAWQEFKKEDGADRVKKMAPQLGKGILYAALAVTALQTALSSSSSSGSSSGGKGKSQGGGGGTSTDGITAQLMQAPGGQWLVGLVGLGILGYGLYYVYLGWTDGFYDKLDGSPKSSEASTAYRWTGRAGYVAKGIAIGMVGLLFGYAAITHDAQKSGGLDQALQEIASQPFGQVLLTLVALGIACYGLFAFARARHFSR